MRRAALPPWLVPRMPLPRGAECEGVTQATEEDGVEWQAFVDGLPAKLNASPSALQSIMDRTPEGLKLLPSRQHPSGSTLSEAVWTYTMEASCHFYRNGEPSSAVVAGSGWRDRC